MIKQFSYKNILASKFYIGFNFFITNYSILPGSFVN